MLLLKGKHSERWKVISLEADGLFLKDLGKAHAAQVKLQIRNNFMLHAAVDCLGWLLFTVD